MQPAPLPLLLLLRLLVLLWQLERPISPSFGCALRSQRTGRRAMEAEQSTPDQRLPGAARVGHFAGARLVTGTLERERGGNQMKNCQSVNV